MPPPLSDEDLDAEENEFGSLEDDSPPSVSDHGFLPTSMSMSQGGMSSAMQQHPGVSNVMASHGMVPQHHAHAHAHGGMIQPHLLQQHM